MRRRESSPTQASCENIMKLPIGFCEAKYREVICSNLCSIDIIIATGRGNFTS